MSTPTAGPSQPRTERAALSRELADFLIEFSIALNKHAMYPAGHPALRPAAEAVVERLATLFQQRSSLALGVARNQLVIEGVATDPKHPVLSDLAARLHRHHLGAVTFRQGVDTDELQDLLSLIAVEAEHSGQPLGLGPPEQLSAWQHLRLHALTYERLELIEKADHEASEQDDTRSRTRAAQLWIGLARAALAVDDDERELPHTDAALVARAINEHQGGTAYDQVIVGYMLQIANELGHGSPEILELRQRTSKLISSLERSTIQRLLEMGGDRSQRQQFLLNASQGMAVDAVLDLVQAASEVQGAQTISHSLLRMLQKLARHSEGGSATRREAADNGVRQQVTALIRRWALPDPNPTEYQEALERMARAEPIFAVAPEQSYRPEPRRLLEMAIEVNVMGDQVLQAVHELADGQDLKWLLRTLETADAPAVTQAAWRYLGSPEMIRRIALTEPIDREVLDRLVAQVGAAAAEPLLDALGESQSLPSRRILIDRLVSLGPAVGPVVVERLADKRWYVQRNMLTILSALPELLAGFNPAEFLQHADTRVRQEAIRLLLRHPSQRERAIGLALADSDETVVLLGLTAALDGCPEAAVPLVMSRATSGETGKVRTLSVRVLGASGRRIALETLLEFVAPRRPLFRLRPPPKTAEYLAALTAVRQFSDDPRVRRALSLAAASADPEISRRARGTVAEES